MKNLSWIVIACVLASSAQAQDNLAARTRGGLQLDRQDIPKAPASASKPAREKMERKTTIAPHERGLFLGQDEIPRAPASASRSRQPSGGNVAESGLFLDQNEIPRAPSSASLAGKQNSNNSGSSKPSSSESPNFGDDDEADFEEFDEDDASPNFKKNRTSSLTDSEDSLEGDLDEVRPGDRWTTYETTPTYGWSSQGNHCYTRNHQSQYYYWPQKNHGHSWQYHSGSTPSPQNSHSSWTWGWGW